MAIVRDYLGRWFGDFVIEKSIGSGAEAEILQCLQNSTGMRYVLRLDVHDDALWEKEPLLPPENASVEWPNAKGMWLVAPTYYKATMAKLAKNADEWKITVPAMYGVLDNRYLVPVASPVRVKGAIDIDQLLQLAPADDLYLFGFWEEILGAMVGDAYDGVTSGDTAWASRWANLLGGVILIDAAERYLRGGTLSTAEQAAVVEAISHGGGGDELAENILLRICGCMERSRMTLEQVKALFQCTHFRINVRPYEALQLNNVYKILRSQSFAPEQSLGMVQFVMNLLTEPPAEPSTQPELFEIRTEQPDLQRFKLMLQEHAAMKQEIFTIGRQ